MLTQHLNSSIKLRWTRPKVVTCVTIVPISFEFSVPTCYFRKCKTTDAERKFCIASQIWSTMFIQNNACAHSYTYFTKKSHNVLYLGLNSPRSVCYSSVRWSRSSRGLVACFVVCCCWISWPAALNSAGRDSPSPGVPAPVARRALAGIGSRSWRGASGSPRSAVEAARPPCCASVYRRSRRRRCRYSSR